MSSASFAAFNSNKKKRKMEHSNHLHTHAHKTQTYWPSQANNKLIWAILVLRRGTKQQDQRGRGSISPEMRCASLPCYFLTPVASPFLTCRVDIITTVSGADLWHPAPNNGQHSWNGGNVCFAPTTLDSRPCVLPSMHNSSAVWLGFHGYNPHPPLATNLSSHKKKKQPSCQTLFVDPIMHPTGHYWGAASFSEWNLLKLTLKTCFLSFTLKLNGSCLLLLAALTDYE